MKSLDQVGLTFCNIVLNQGILNGVINVNLGATLFSVGEDGTKIEVDPVVVARLRLDLPCARRLRDALSKLLDSVDQAKTVDTPLPAETEEPVAAESLN